MNVSVSDEVLSDGLNLYEALQRHAAGVFIRSEIDKLAAVTSPEFARWAYMPTAFEGWS